MPAISYNDLTNKPSTPSLQSVTTAGNTSTNGIKIGGSLPSAPNIDLKNNGEIVTKSALTVDCSKPTLYKMAVGMDSTHQKGIVVMSKESSRNNQIAFETRTTTDNETLVIRADGRLECYKYRLELLPLLP